MAEKKTYALPNRVTVDRVEEIKQQMLNLLHCSENRIELAGNDVGMVDAAGLQLLISFYKSVSKDKKQLLITEPSPELSKIMAYSGADKVLPIEEGI